MPNGHAPSALILQSRGEMQRAHAQQQREDLRLAFNALAAQCRHDVEILATALRDLNERLRLLELQRVTLSAAFEEHRLAETRREQSLWLRLRFLVTGR